MPGLVWRKWSLSPSLVFSHFPGRTPSTPLVPIFNPLPYLTTSNSICIVIALVNSTIWHWSSSDSLCLGCIKSGDADTMNVCARVCVWVCLFVCVSGVRHTAAPSLCSFFFQTTTTVSVDPSVYPTWLVQVSLFISMQIRHKDVTEMRHDYKTLLSHIYRWLYIITNTS